MVNFDNNLAGPYFFLDEGVAVVNTDDEVDRGPKNEGLMLCDVEVKEEGILGSGVEAEG